MSAPLLEMTGITKTFPGVRALDSVDFELQAGEIHALLGENGAGKSTLVGVLSGVHRREEGQIRLLGRAIEPSSPAEAGRLGIACVYQEINLVLELSVAENLMLGHEPRRMGCILRGELARRARLALDRLGLDLDPSLPLGDYPLPIRQMTAIARALWLSARILVLDEPTSSLDAAESARLFGVLRGLRSQGLGILFITHFLDQVYEICDRLTVLRNGRLVGTFTPNELPRLKLVEQMIGREAQERFAAPATTGSDLNAGHGVPLLEVRGLYRRHAVEQLDLDVQRGEVVGLAGLLGSGRSEAVRAIFGIDPVERGSIALNGRCQPRLSPRKAIRLGMALAPEDRRAAGILPELSVRENIILAMQAARPWWKRIGSRQQIAIARRFIQALSIATPDQEKPVGQLSGGNQQKVILARWLLMEPKLLMLDEPTRGIDVGARAEIEALIRELRDRGMALILVSSELEELERICGRVFVLRDRSCVGILEGEDISVDRIMGVIAAPAGGSRA